MYALEMKILNGQRSLSQILHKEKSEFGFILSLVICLRFQIKINFEPLLQFQKEKNSMWKICYAALLLCVIKLTKGSNFMLGLNDSLLLSQNYSGITAIESDSEGYFYVGFNDGEVRKYSPTFSSYISINMPAVVNQFHTRKIELSTTLENGTFLNLTSKKLVTFTNNFTTINDYNINTYAQEEQYDLNYSIIDQLGFPFKVSNVSHTFHIIISNVSVMVAYQGVTASLMNYFDTFGKNFTCTAAINQRYNFTINQNLITANSTFYISLDDTVYSLDVSLIFAFNYISNHFDLINKTLQYSNFYHSSTPINFFGIASQLLMMQSNSTGLTTVYNFNSSSIKPATSIPCNQSLKFFYIYESYYLLQSTGLLKLSYSSSSNNLYVNSVMVSLPYNAYRLEFGTYFNPFYIIGEPYIYKAGKCLGQSKADENGCVWYNCTVDKCSSCLFSPQICSSCEFGYSLTLNYTCSFNFSTNSNSNSSINSNSTSNTSSNTNSSTNSSINSSSTTNTNSTDTPQVLEQIPSQSLLSLLIEQLINIFNFLISVPTARRVISPVFYYFGIFDDIYLYQFHDRIYGDTMNSVFINLNQMQTKKWSIVNYQTVLALFSIDSEVFDNFTDYQVAYNSYNNYGFTDVNHTNVGTQGLWGNSQNFFLVALPTTLIGFFILRMLFRLSFNHEFSKLLRKFDFWPFLFLLLLDGNIQQLAFYLATDWRNIFFFGFATKLMKMQVVFFGFIIIIISVCLYFTSYGFYSRLNKHVMDNNKNVLLGQTSLMMQIGARNCYFGIVNSFSRGLGYRSMLAVLAVSQMVFSIYFILSIPLGIYKHNLKIWIYILLNLIKMVLIVTLFVDYGNVNLQIIEMAQHSLIILEIIVFCIGVLLETFLTVKQITMMAKNFFKFKNGSLIQIINKPQESTSAEIAKIVRACYNMKSEKLTLRQQRKNLNGLKVMHFQPSIADEIIIEPREHEYPNTNRQNRKNICQENFVLHAITQ